MLDVNPSVNGEANWLRVIDWAASPLKFKEMPTIIQAIATIPIDKYASEFSFGLIAIKKVNVPLLLIEKAINKIPTNKINKIAVAMKNLDFFFCKLLSLNKIINFWRQNF